MLCSLGLTRNLPCAVRTTRIVPPGFLLTCPGCGGRGGFLPAAVNLQPSPRIGGFAGMARISLVYGCEHLVRWETHPSNRTTGRDHAAPNSTGVLHGGVPSHPDRNEARIGRATQGGCQNLRRAVAGPLRTQIVSRAGRLLPRPFPVDDQQQAAVRPWSADVVGASSRITAGLEDGSGSSSGRGGCRIRWWIWRTAPAGAKALTPKLPPASA